jgi:transposase InsO family protein
MVEDAFLRHGPPKHIITDKEGVFVGDVFAELLRHWNVKQRFGAVGKHGSIAVTERAILTLKHEWLKRVPVIRGMDHLTSLLVDFELYYNEYRRHMTLRGAVPQAVHRGERWQRPDRSAKAVASTVERRFFPDTRTTAYRLAA